MTRIHRLRHAKDFRALFRFGRRKESHSFKLAVLPNHLPFSRFAFIAPKSVDKRAVVRNRLRRRCREWIRTRAPSFPRPLDVAIWFKNNAKHATKKEFYDDLTLLFKSYE